MEGMLFIIDQKTLQGVYNILAKLPLGDAFETFDALRQMQRYVPPEDNGAESVTPAPAERIPTGLPLDRTPEHEAALDTPSDLREELNRPRRHKRQKK